MNFSIEDIGRKIIIHDLEGADWLTKKSEYIIENIISRHSVLLKGAVKSWKSTKAGSWSFVYDKKEEFNKGDKVILNKETTSLKKGHPTIVKGFIDDNKERIIVEGLMPGGWINSKSLIRMIETEKYRIKKAIELLSEFGPSFMQTFGYNDNDIHILGKELSELNVRQHDNEVIVDAPHEIYLNPSVYTDKKYEPLEIYVGSEREIKGINLGYTGIEITQVVDKNYRDIRKGFDPDNSKSVVEFCKEYMRKGYIKIGQILLTIETFRIIKKETNEELQAVPLLPF